MALKTTVYFWLFLLVVTFDTISHGCVEGLRTLDISKFPPKPRGTIKTIEVPEDGDLIDCIDIYKQPAFDHPLINEIQMEPSPETFHEFNKLKGPMLEITQNWHKYGMCPNGTVPIRRAWNNTGISHRAPNDEDFSLHEYASAHVPEDKYYGASAKLNVWNPHVGPHEMSLSQVWVVSEPGTDELNSVEAGWIVYPDLYGDAQTRLFTFWTRDNYKTTRCYNTQCTPGFMQTNFKYSLGSVISPTSVFAGNQYDIYIGLSRDRRTGNWWLYFQDSVVGYWPRELFTSLGDGANEAEFGGEITNKKTGNRHTTAQMGSGYFPGLEFGKASFVKNANVMNKFEFVVDADLQPVATNPNCYDIKIAPKNREDGSHFYFGGPGYSAQCP